MLRPVLDCFAVTSFEPMLSGWCWLGRVPLVDAKRYVAALRARKGAQESQVFVFNEDTHALDRPQTEFEQWLTVAAFLKKHMQ